MSFLEKRGYYRRTMIISIIVLIAVIIFATNIGVANINFEKTSRIILSKIPFINNLVAIDDIKETSIIIILKIRLPRIILAALVGSGLSIVGAAFQGIFKNPMAEPYVLGVSSGASVGATIAIVLGLGLNFFGITVETAFAFVGAVLTTLLVYSIARVGNKVPVVNLLLSGVVISFFFSSIISILMTLNRDKVDKIIFWLMGSVSAASYNQILMVATVVIAGFIIIYYHSRELNVILMGEEEAKTMGVNVERVKKRLLLISSLVVGVIVSFSGIIGFVGLIIPHVVRLIFSSDNRIVIPFSAVYGAVFMIACDTIARVALNPAELPVGVITSFFGAPFFIYLLNKSKKKVL